MNDKKLTPNEVLIALGQEVLIKDETHYFKIFDATLYKQKIGQDSWEYDNRDLEDFIRENLWLV